MAKSLEVTNYGELIALLSALNFAKFHREPYDYRIALSPYIANIANQIVKILDEMEIERGKPERANWRQAIAPEGEVWQIAIRNASNGSGDYWNTVSFEKKKEIAAILLSPFAFTEEILTEFIAQVDERLSNTPN